MNNQRRTFPLTYMVNGVSKTTDVTIPRWLERFVPDLDNNGIPDQLDTLIENNPELASSFDLGKEQKQSPSTQSAVPVTPPTSYQPTQAQSQMSPTNESSIQNVFRGILLIVGLIVIAVLVF